MKRFKENLKVKYFIYCVNRRLFNNDFIKGRFFFCVSRKDNLFLIFLYDKKHPNVNKNYCFVKNLNKTNFLDIINRLSYLCDGEDYRYIGFDYFKKLED